MVEPSHDSDFEEQAPTRFRVRSRTALGILAFAVLASYVIFGLPMRSFPGRAGIGELRHVEATLNRAYEECGLDEQATINWFTGRVEVPSSNDLALKVPQPVEFELATGELQAATGRALFVLVSCSAVRPT